MNIDKFKLKSEYRGHYKHNIEELGFNTIVISGPCQGDIKDYEMIGRLVQVRKKMGDFGTDLVLLRILNGDLQSFTNQGFFTIDNEYKDEINKLFKDVYLDVPDIEYSICGKEKYTGFIIASKEYKISKRKEKLNRLFNG